MATSIYEIKDSLIGKKIAIDDIVTSYSSKKESHKSAWAFLIKSQLSNLGLEVTVLTKEQNIHDFDVWMVVLPMEFQGTYNLFGGAGDEPAGRIQRLIDFTGKIYSINREMPDLGAFVQSRIKSCTDNWKSLDVSILSSRSNSVKTIDLTLKSNTFILGDSHSISAYVPGANISRNDGKTLFGILKEGMSSYIPEDTDHLITYLGNIDIRHHLCRQPNPIAATESLVYDYVQHLKSLKIPNISAVQLLPIEHEDRRIPKTGFYKGTPFYGSLEKRLEICQIFNKMLSIYLSLEGFDLIKWPNHWYQLSPREFADVYMEKPGSVHLSRKYYQYDFETGLKNTELKPKTSSLF
jgi:hypothetical protein